MEHCSILKVLAIASPVSPPPSPLPGLTLSDPGCCCCCFSFTSFLFLCELNCLLNHSLAFFSCSSRPPLQSHQSYENASPFGFMNRTGLMILGWLFHINFWMKEKKMLLMISFSKPSYTYIQFLKKKTPRALRNQTSPLVAEFCTWNRGNWYGRLHGRRGRKWAKRLHPIW